VSDSGQAPLESLDHAYDPLGTEKVMEMYEQKSIQPLTRANFLVRLLLHFLITLGLMVGSLGIGIVGYVSLERFTIMDAFLNTAMLLGGMGPVNPPLTDAGKLFAGIFALYAGLVFVVSGAILITPVVHRLLHVLHWDEDR
jgi:hypothetical protein